MSIHKPTLFSHLAKQKKAELLTLLEAVFDAMPESLHPLVFGEVYKETSLPKWNAAQLLAEIRQFRADSLAKKYYASFNINSKNYRHIPDETEAWFSTTSRFIDLCVQMVAKKASLESTTCFEEALALITLMENNSQIVFADEYGSWMISSPRGYLHAYVKAWAQVADPTVFADKIAPWLKWDSVNSFADKVYDAVRQYASTEQLKVIQDRIETDKIRLPEK